MPVALAVVLGTTGVVGYALWAANGGLVREGNWVGVDFHVYYQAAKALGRGQNIYDAGIAPPYVYPPLLAILVFPLSQLGVNTATIFWKFLQHACLIAAGSLLITLLPVSRVVRILAAGLLLFGLLTAPLLDEIQVGESNSLVLLLVVAAVWLMVRGRSAEPAVGGVLLGLAAAIKVLPLLLVAYLWWRGPRRVAITATVAFLALQLASLAITPATLTYWFREFPGLFGQAFPFLDNQSLNAAISRALLPSDPSGPATQMADGAALRPVITWIANLLVLGATTWVLWRAGPSTGVGNEKRRDFLLEVGLVLLTIHLVSGSTWLHHLIDVSVPLLALLAVWWAAMPRAGAEPRDYRRALLAVLVPIIALLLLIPHPTDWVFWADKIAPSNGFLAWLASSVPMWVVIALWIAVAARLRQARIMDHEVSS